MPAAKTGVQKDAAPKELKSVLHQPHPPVVNAPAAGAASDRPHTRVEGGAPGPVDESEKY